MQSCREVLDTLELGTGENASLIMARYIKNLDDKNDSKRDLFTAMTKAASNAQDLYSLAFRTRHDALAMTATPGYFRTIQALAAGLGNSNVIETGLALNPTYGVPMLPASSIKGVTAHYCAEVFGPADSRFRGPMMMALPGKYTRHCSGRQALKVNRRQDFYDFMTRG